MAVHAPLTPAPAADPADLLSALESSRSLAVAQHRPHPRQLTALLSRPGIERLLAAQGLTRFCELTAAFVGQGPLQCGLTSLAVALNSQSPGRAVPHTADRLQEQLRGLLGNPRCAFGRFFSSTIDEIGMLAREHHRRVSVRKADRSSLDQFRQEALAALQAGGAVIVNFERRLVGYDSHFAGHMSPLAAYHGPSDSFLLYDVAIKTWQPVWIPAELLFNGMDTLDKPRDASCPCSSRGYLVLHADH